MRITMITLLVFCIAANAYSKSFISTNSNIVATGKIIIDGSDVWSNSSLKGSGNVKKITRKVGPFSAISSQGSFDIIYDQGPYSVAITGDDNLINWVSTKVVEDILILSMDKSYNTKQALIINISSPTIDYFIISGTSDLAINDIETDNLTINLKGAVDVVANGSVTKLQLNVHGAGDVAARRLITDSANVSLHGSGDILLTARNELNVKLNGTGDITYFGRPYLVNTDVSGVGDVAMGN